MTGPLKPIQKTKAQQVFGRRGHNKYNTIDGRNPAPPGILNDIESPANNGINYQPQLVSLPDF